MSRASNCCNNAKYQLTYHRRLATRAEARTDIFDYIEAFYNRTRLQSALASRSPRQFEQLFPSN